MRERSIGGHANTPTHTETNARMHRLNSASSHVTVLSKFPVELGTAAMLSNMWVWIYQNCAFGLSDLQLDLQLKQGTDTIIDMLGSCVCSGIFCVLNSKREANI